VNHRLARMSQVPQITTREVVCIGRIAGAGTDCSDERKINFQNPAIMGLGII
jgi:hypothetical protein